MAFGPLSLVNDGTTCDGPRRGIPNRLEQQEWIIVVDKRDAPNYKLRTNAFRVIHITRVVSARDGPHGWRTETEILRPRVKEDQDMRPNASLAAVLSLLLGVSSGCSRNPTARYVYRDGNHGVIGLTNNTESTRRQAERLMIQHFPDGYDIVREEEIDTGSRKSDQTTGASSKFTPNSAIAKLIVGEGSASTEAKSNFVDNLKLHEARIIYRNRKSMSQAGFASIASITPEMYVDPNRGLRDQDGEGLLATAKPKTDVAIKQASGSD